jgi:hypothetical protein
MIKVEANKEIFDLWQSVSYGVRNLGSIVQNDMELTPEQYMQWVVHVSNTRTLFEALVKKTMDHIEAKK